MNDSDPTRNDNRQAPVELGLIEGSWLATAEIRTWHCVAENHPRPIRQSQRLNPLARKPMVPMACGGLFFLCKRLTFRCNTHSRPVPKTRPWDRSSSEGFHLLTKTMWRRSPQQSRMSTPGTRALAVWTASIGRCRIQFREDEGTPLEFQTTHPNTERRLT
jgi:hypothetical protein